MRVRVLFFAQLKDAFGTHECTVNPEENTTVHEVVHDLMAQKGAEHLKAMPILYSVNEDFVDEFRKLQDNDVLALLPPVAGG